MLEENSHRNGGAAIAGVPRTAASSARVLIVDDSPLTRMFVTEALETEGIRVESHDNAWMAQKVSEFGPDLVLVDVKLGKATLDGAVAVKAMRQTRFADRTRFVLYSGTELDELRDVAKGCGADGYLAKDGEPEALARSVRSLLQREPMGRRVS